MEFLHNYEKSLGYYFFLQYPTQKKFVQYKNDITQEKKTQQ